MNLGDANLKSVNAGRPQLLHSFSKRSVAASDDYYSFSEHASEDSSIGSLVTVVRYETPPSQARSLAPSPDKLQPDALLSLKAQDLQPLSESAGVPLVVDLHKEQADENEGDRPVDHTVEETMDDELSPPTPGVDDTPYIRFAIDQLTRDEELTGRRRGGSVDTEASYLVERIVPDEGLGFYKREGRPPIRKEQPPERSEENPVILREEGLFIPVDITHDNYRYPKLEFLPGVLRPLSTIPLILCCCLMIGVLIFCNKWSARHNGISDYDGVGTRLYFVYQYLPQLLAGLIVIWRFVLEAAIHRVLPFSSLASGRSSERFGALHNISLFPSRFILPDVALFRQRQPLLGCCFLIFWVSTFTIPLQASAFQTRLIIVNGSDTWRWTAVQPVSWTLVALYVLLVFALLATLVQFHRRQTGLVWDATSLADLLVLIQQSNILHEFHETETSIGLRSKDLWRNHRLGYWRLSNKPQEIFYAIGLEQEPVRGLNIEQDRPIGKAPKLRYQDPAGYDIEGQRPLESATIESLQTSIHSSAIRYRWTPWFLQDTFVVAWTATALVLLGAFIVVSFVKQAVRIGFHPQLAAATTSMGFSPAGFLYSFIPSLIGLMLFLLWQPFDMYFRALQPFSNLADSRGASAEESLLLNYTSCLPIVVSVRAAAAGHYKVAWFSFVSLISIIIPILGGGIFTAQFFTSEREVRVAADMSGFYALLVFLILYAISFLLVWPTATRRLPHDIKTLADLISFLYQSPLLNDPAFKEPKSKTDLVTSLLNASHGEGPQPRYGFGMFRGRDGEEHLGIDQLQRPGSEEMIITTGTNKR